MATTDLTVSIDPVMTLMMTKQRVFQARLLDGREPAELSDVEKMAYIREQSLALTDEIHEAMAETGWKSWATSNHINRDAYLGELADVYIFFMNLLLVADITASDLARVVLAKQHKNHKRQDDGYDGVSTKCPSCKRAYDDNAVDCYPPENPIPVGEPRPILRENSRELDHTPCTHPTTLNDRNACRARLAWCAVRPGVGFIP